jgi:hypothetical protein
MPKISLMTELEAAPAVGDFFVLVDTDVGATKKLSSANALSTCEKTANKAAASGYASLNSSSTVVQNPANATATATASKIVIADGSGKVDTWVSAASITVPGIAELAINTEVDGGSDATRAVTPDALAGSTIFGRKVVQVVVVERATNVTTGDGKADIFIPVALNGMNLVRFTADTITAGITNATTVALYNITDSTEMLTVNASIASTATHATDATIDAAKDDVATNDHLRIDVDAASSGTIPKGLVVTLEFQLP